jgi:hypothetical protein
LAFLAIQICEMLRRRLGVKTFALDRDLATRYRVLRNYSVDLPALAMWLKFTRLRWEKGDGEKGRRGEGETVTSYERQETGDRRQETGRVIVSPSPLLPFSISASPRPRVSPPRVPLPAPPPASLQIRSI